MRRFRFTLAYDGQAYVGFQVQPQGTSIQSVLEKAFKTIFGEDVRVIPSGRTDAGVSAVAQVCHVEVKTELALARLKRPDALYRFNAVLPEDVAVTALKPAAGFHARIDAKNKTYEYFILESRRRNPFLEKRVWRIPQELDINTMRKAALHLKGRHDFSSLCASDSTALDKTREILEIRVDSRSPAPLFKLPGEKYIHVRVTGTGFLKQMVRNIVGTLVEVGLGRMPPEQIKEILRSRDRKQAGRSAPAHGLYMTRVRYG